MEKEIHCEKPIDYNQVVENIRELINKKDYNRALQICYMASYKNVLEIQSEKLYILAQKFNDYNTAYKEWLGLKEYNDVNIVSKGINILMHLDKLDEALEYANNHQFDDISYIRSRVKLLFKCNLKAEALELCKNPKYAEDEVIMDMRLKLEENETKETNIKETNIYDEISDVLTRIYSGSITIDEIKQTDIAAFEKSVLLVAYYEKNNIKEGINFIKKLRKIDKLEEKQKKTYNILFNRLNKSKYFDVTTYSSILNRYVNFLKIDELNSTKEESSVSQLKPEVELKEETILPNKKIIEPKKIKQDNSKMVEVVGTRVNSRYSNTNSSNNVNSQKHTILIKDVLSNELNEIGKYLYVMMQLPDSRKNAIKAWDNLENMAYKPITDKETLRKLINIILKVSVEHPEIVDADSRKLVKLLEK